MNSDNDANYVEPRMRPLEDFDLPDPQTRETELRKWLEDLWREAAERERRNANPDVMEDDE